MNESEQRLHETLLESMRLNGDLLKKDRKPSEKAPMNQIDPQEFGEMRAQVRALLEADRERTAVLTQLSENVNLIRLQLAKAQGGYTVLTVLVTAAGSVGALATWLISHFWKS